MASSRVSKDVIREDWGRNAATEGTQTNGRGEGMGSDATTSGTKTNRICKSYLKYKKVCDSIKLPGFLRLVEQSEQLLPGIPNEITLDQICTKLPWTVFHLLSSVSRCWKQAIQSHQVYDTRVRSQSTETLVVFDHSLYPEPDRDLLHLYSMSDKSCHQLPHFPSSLYECHCVSLDGKIYILGAVTKTNVESAEVYVLDLAGQRQWQQCASMLDSREEFGCGVLDGKIYVFGGSSRHKDLRGSSEVYDPKVGAWFPIKPMQSSRGGHQVAAIGEELFVFGGWYYGFHFSGRDVSRADDDDIVDNSLYLEAYHPVKNEWRVINVCLPSSELETVFMAKGKFHVMTGFGIEIHDIDKNSWADLQVNYFPTIEPTSDWDSDSDFDPDDIIIKPGVTVAVNDELLAVVEWESSGGDFGRSGVLQSNGFGRKQKEIVWEKPDSIPTIEWPPTFMSPIQL